jgi:hypothetical protein
MAAGLGWEGGAGLGELLQDARRVAGRGDRGGFVE